MKEKMLKKGIVILLLILQLLQLSGNLLYVEASIKEGDTIHLQTDHECDSLVEYWMERYKAWSYKIVWYVYYIDNETKEKYPAFCIEPEKRGIGTGYDSYDATIKNENDSRIWRILDRGYMGSNYKDWNLECDDDFYSATKLALHSLVDGISPKEEYILGNRSVDGNTVEEIQRRGAKVLEVAQTLYEHGINGTETYVSPSVSIIKKGEEKIENIKNVSYYIQSYEVTANKTLKSYDLEIEQFTNGTKILNSENQEQTNLLGLSEKSFKIAIPVNEINKDIKGTINIKNAYIKTNPIFYCNSIIKEAQNYITYMSGYEKASNSTTLEIKADTCSIKIQKIDNETKEPIANVIFEIKNQQGEKIGEVKTDKNGMAEINNLNPQIVTIKEIEVPQPYILSEEEKQVKLEWNKVSNIVFENERKKGNLKIIKVDADNNDIALENVEFELIDNKGNVVEKVKTDNEGQAYINNLEIGIYILKEIKTKEGYELGNDRKIEIKWNETKVEKIENQRQKGQIELYKVDNENKNQMLEDVIFEVLDENKKRVETIITDKNGYAITSKLPIGNYYLKEVKTNNRYILNSDLIQINIEKDKITTLNITNQKKKGQIKILKISEDDNLINGSKKGTPIENVEFEVRNQNGEVVEILVTDEKGIAISKELEKGVYIIKEIKSGNDYEITDEEFEIEIIEHQKIEEIIITNKSKEPDPPKLPRTGF